MTYDLVGWLGSRLLAALQKAETSSQPGHTHPATDINNSTATGRSLITAADAAAARSTLGLGDSATRNVGTTAGTVAAGDDSRLSDARTPTAHTHPLSDLTASGATTGQVPQWSGSAWVPATPSGGGGSPGGSNGQLQYRVDATTFGGMAGTSWNDATRSLTITGATVTDNAPLLNMSQTWNNAAVDFIGLQFNAINTASSARSVLARFARGGAASVDIRGDSVLILGDSISGTHFGVQSNNGVRAVASSSGSLSLTSFLANDIRLGGSALSGNFNNYLGANFGLILQNANFVGWSPNTNSDLRGTQDLTMFRDAAGRLGIRNGANAQAVGIYSTESGSLANFERLNIEWSSNVVYIRPSAAGTGTLRPLIVRHPPITVASLPSAATAGAGARCFVSDATATTFASVVAGGGSNNVPVYSDGTDWRIG